MDIFNPWHDLSLANGDPNYMPPASALRFAKDCEGLMPWLRNAHSPEIMTWGWDAALKKLLVQEGVPEKSLPSYETLAVIRNLSHRKTATMVNQMLLGGLCGCPHIAPLPAREVRTVSAVKKLIEKYGDAAIKAPWSGSGRGLRWGRQGDTPEVTFSWARNIIESQGSIFVEQRVEPVMELAFLYDIWHDSASDVPWLLQNPYAYDLHFEGYSIFDTVNGVYRGNVLASNEDLEAMICRLIPREELERLHDILYRVLRCIFAGKYEGLLGVDMFIFHDGERYILRPCVEVNVRATMGFLARRLYDRIVSGESLGTPGIAVVCEALSNGKPLRMAVEYSPQKGNLLDMPRLASLTEVNVDTQYAVFVEEM